VAADPDSAPEERDVIGVVGEVDPEVQRALDLTPRRVGWLALDLDRLFALATRATRALPVSGFPSSDLDLAFVTDEAVQARDLESALREAASPLLESIHLVDVYRGPSVPAGTRSLAYRLRLSAPDHTLSTEEIHAVRGECIAAAEAGLPARLRG
jgi:phenylalanyl-tRNA synthetase beta chain